MYPTHAFPSHARPASVRTHPHTSIYTGFFAPGKMCAVMGPSGSGKTTYVGVACVCVCGGGGGVSQRECVDVSVHVHVLFCAELVLACQAG